MFYPTEKALKALYEKLNLSYSKNNSYVNEIGDSGCRPVEFKRFYEVETELYMLMKYLGLEVADSPNKKIVKIKKHK
jgi:hypothetical protein